MVPHKITCEHSYAVTKQITINKEGRLDLQKQWLVTLPGGLEVTSRMLFSDVVGVVIIVLLQHLPSGRTPWLRVVQAEQRQAARRHDARTAQREDLSRGETK
jgi:hypothetical protein